jgi:hypothetical protein
LADENVDRTSALQRGTASRFVEVRDNTTEIRTLSAYQTATERDDLVQSGWKPTGGTGWKPWRSSPQQMIPAARGHPQRPSPERHCGARSKKMNDRSRPLAAWTSQLRKSSLTPSHYRFRAPNGCAAGVCERFEPSLGAPLTAEVGSSSTTSTARGTDEVRPADCGVKGSGLNGGSPWRGAATEATAPSIKTRR